MSELFQESLTVMGNAFRRLESQLDAPERIPYKDGFIFRFKEKGLPQALIQKLARNITGLTAVDVLLTHGLSQEQGVIQRVLDEINEDIFFLAAAINTGVVTDKHEKFLAAFYDDPMFTAPTVAGRWNKPNLVPRKKVRAYVHETLSDDDNTSAALDAGENLGTAYSGFVHVSSAHVMDMYGGNPARFHIKGMSETGRAAEFTRDAWNYFYRGLLATAAVAKVFGDGSLATVLAEYISKFEKESGTNYLGDAAKA